MGRFEVDAVSAETVAPEAFIFMPRMCRLEERPFVSS